MTGSGHRNTALALAIMGGVYLGVPAGFAWGVGCLTGACGPDYLEIQYGSGAGRKTLLKHRTWTHYPYFWIAALIYLATQWAATPYHLFAAGWLAAGLLHLLMDFLTPMGIPFLTPWGDRYGLGVFRTGGAEWVAITLVWLWGLALPLYLYRNDILGSALLARVF